MAVLSRNLDLNLLIVFDLLWSERSVSRAARRLHRTQSAVSLALERLRGALGDPLFNWNGREMQPTARAEALAPRIRAIVNQVNEVLDLQSDDPRKARREFAIATADYIDWLLGGALMARLAAEAPKLTLHFLDVKPAMTEGRRGAETDLFIVPKGAVNTHQMNHTPLFAIATYASRRVITLRYMRACRSKNSLRCRRPPTAPCAAASSVTRPSIWPNSACATRIAFSHPTTWPCR